MKKKFFNYPIESIIEANLQLQTVQRSLSQQYKIFNPQVNTITCERFINLYSSWDEKKKSEFIITIGGKVNFKKVKYFFDQKIEEKKI